MFPVYIIFTYVCQSCIVVAYLPCAASPSTARLSFECQEKLGAGKDFKNCNMCIDMNLTSLVTGTMHPEQTKYLLTRDRDPIVLQ
jgi:hypothetical protein